MSSAESPGTLDPKTMKHWAGLRLAHEAVMMQDAQHVLHRDRADVSRHRQQMTSPAEGVKPTNSPPSDECEMGDIRIGDEVHHHYPAPPSTPGPAPAASKAGKLVQAAVFTAGLLAGGPATMGVLSYLKPNPASPVIQMPEIPERPGNIGAVKLMPPAARSTTAQ
jgi:hypothetical protein